MKENKEITISISSILFHVAAVVFLAIAAYYIYLTYESIVTYKTQYAVSPELADVLNAYFSNCAPYFAYAIICYGIGLAIKRVQVLTDTLVALMDQSIDEHEKNETFTVVSDGVKE